MSLSLFHLHGDLNDLKFPRLLATLRDDRFTGVFQATTPGRSGGEPAAGEALEVTREIHFLEGRIAWAISTEKEESLRAYMVRNGALTASRWAEAEQQARDGTVRDALVALGIVGARELKQIEKGRAEEIVLALFAIHEGEYRVRERQLSPGTPDLKIDPRPLILKGVLERGDQGLVLWEIGSLDAIYAARKPSAEDEGLAFPGEFQSVLRHVDGHRSIAQICSLTSLPENFVCSIMAALSMIGAIRRHQGKSREVRPAEPLSTVEQMGLSAEVERPREASREQNPPTPARYAGAAPVPPKIKPRLEEAPPEREARFDETPEDDFVQVADAAEFEDSVEVQETGPLEEWVEVEAPRSAERPSAYDSPLPRDTSRPWFLLGGGAAVGFAALFLLLMGHDAGDAGEVIRPVSEAAPQTAIEENTDEPDSADGSRDSLAQPPPPVASSPPASFRATPAPVAPPAATSILRGKIDSERSARESLRTGDYVAAARQFGREVSRGHGGFTIQLLTACQEATVKQAVDRAGGSSRLFILATSLDGRTCYRVYWGRYPSLARAREALRRDVPEPFRRQQSQPRVTRLGGA